ncbi:MAG: hypothetical protein CMK32_00330 [Porticoccaceae bacterium]|nr:hypothetical protein [Porticoccaceae bacterium]
MLYSNRFVAVTAIAILSAIPQVQAQIAESDPETEKSGRSYGIAEIVVTARRQEESIQSTPVAVTAFTSEAISQKQIVDIPSIQQTTPGLVITTNHSGVGISLRGQVQTSADSSVDQSVGLYVDGIYVARQMGGRFDLVDVERVEVLHGPQGTLFGRNTTGGAVNITTNQPTDIFEGSATFGIGNFDRVEGTAIVNMPLFDGVAARFVARHMEHSGYGENVFLGRDVGDDNYDHFRGSFKIAPADDWSLIISGEYIDRSNNGPMVQPTAFVAGVPDTGFSDLSFYDFASEQRTFENITMANGSATLSVDIGEVTFKSITAYRDLKVHTLSDFDTTPLPLFFNEANSRIRQITQEAQLFGKIGPLDWLVGGFYFVEKGPERYDIFGGFLAYDSRIRHESYAPYSQVTYHVNEQLRLTAGIRYTKDERDLTASNTLGGGCFINVSELDDVAGCISRKSLSDNYFSYTASVDYQFADGLFLYARTGMAHKSGGFNKTNSGLEPFGPEKVTDYELGVKSDFFDRHLRINMAVFTSDYEDMQRPLTSDSTGVPIVLVQSVGEARIRGAEIEVTAIPVEGLEVYGNIGFLDPEYRDFSDASGDRSDEPFTRVSERTWSLGATFEFPVSYGTYRMHADYGHQSRKYFFPSPLTREPDYGVLNVRLSVELTRPRLEIALWGRNLTEREYLVENLDFIAAAQVNPGFPGEPRTYGVSVTHQFGD